LAAAISTSMKPGRKKAVRVAAAVVVADAAATGAMAAAEAVVDAADAAVTVAAAVAAEIAGNSFQNKNCRGRSSGALFNFPATCATVTGVIFWPCEVTIRVHLCFR
jgi:hypothetical protein